ncbi:MAG: D-alanyl-D-alanine carboxypeptidase family protein [Hyphomicrobiaceae bacterium]|nr:D-alanyl-D-alanine carboxypeptidase family protein [Hyphomicrobiaceae bacterium]
MPRLVVAFNSRLAALVVSMVVISAIVMALAGAGPAGTARAQGAPVAAYKTAAKQAIVVDYETGAILFQQNADALVPPASMSKLMTLAVVFKALRDGKLRLDEEVLVSEDAWRRGGAPSRTSAMFVPVNTKVTVEELLQGIVVQSGNDASIALAERLAGSEPAFAKMMEAEARRIGLTRATFRNATGLPHAEHLMTARELAHLTAYLIREFPDHYKRFGQTEFKFRKHLFRNRNPFVSADIKGDGLKTGFTQASGYGAVGSVARGDRRLIVVLNGLETSISRRDEAVKITEWAFKGFSPYQLFAGGEIVGQARVWGGESFYVPLTGGDEPVTILLSRLPMKQRLAAEITYQGPLKAPIAKGQRVATLRARSILTNTVNEVPLYAAEDVAEASVVRRGLDSIAMFAFRWVADQAAGLVEKL